MKTRKCLDCPTVFELKPNGHNRVRCLPCSAIRKAETDKAYKDKQRELYPGYDTWYQKEANYETIEDEIQKCLNALTWPKLDFNQTPKLDMLIQHNT